LADKITIKMAKEDLLSFLPEDGKGIEKAFIMVKVNGQWWRFSKKEARDFVRSICKLKKKVG
jgi:hypothetical protein